MKHLTFIYQAQNKPLHIDAGRDLTGAEIDISLFINGDELKHWTESDIEIMGNDILCPLTQEETAAFPAGKAFAEMKTVIPNTESVTQFEVYPVCIRGRFDKTTMGVTE